MVEPPISKYCSSKTGHVWQKVLKIRYVSNHNCQQTQHVWLSDQLTNPNVQWIFGKLSKVLIPLHGNIDPPDMQSSWYFLKCQTTTTTTTNCAKSRHLWFLRGSHCVSVNKFSHHTTHCLETNAPWNAKTLGDFLEPRLLLGHFLCRKTLRKKLTCLNKC